jgi:hypothetical protein
VSQTSQLPIPEYFTYNSFKLKDLKGIYRQIYDSKGLDIKKNL